MTKSIRLPNPVWLLSLARCGRCNHEFGAVHLTEQRTKLKCGSCRALKGIASNRHIILDGPIEPPEIFTPVVIDSEKIKGENRVTMLISKKDEGRYTRGPGYKGTVTDLLTGKKYHVVGKPCSIPECYCDAWALAHDFSRTLSQERLGEVFTAMSVWSWDTELEGTMTHDAQCPECGAELQIAVERERYGEDADGNRGEWRTSVEVTKQSCTHELSDETIDSLVEG